MSSHATPIAAINVTPLVDVLLVLLIIFMITAPQLTQRFTLNLPQKSPPEQVQPQALHLQIAEDGLIVLDGELVSTQLLRAEMAFLATRTQRPLIEVDPADNVAYQHVVSVLSDLKGAGITRIGFRER